MATSERLMAHALEEVAHDTFTIESNLRLSPGFYLRSRMVVIRDGRDLLVHSPLPMATEWPETISALGNVRVLVAPNAYHHLYFKDAIERFPDALAVGTPALTTKRKDLSLDAELGWEPGNAPDGWFDSVQPIAVGGAPAISEYLFFDTRSKALLVSDLLFNNERPTSLMTRMFVRMTSGWKGPARSRIWRFLIKDKSGFSASLESLSNLDIERVIPAHGTPFDDAALAVSLMQTGKPPAST